MMRGSMRLLSMMRNDEREHEAPIHDESGHEAPIHDESHLSVRHYDECRHHDECEHNDGRVSPLVNKGEPLFANNLPLGELCTSN
jgi:hypothetical protein